MKKGKLITFEDFCKENFTTQEMEEINVEAEKRIAIRQLKELRKKHNLTQDKLAMKSGLPRSTISRIETGKRNVSIAKLIQIANALGKDLEIRFVERKKKEIT